MATVFAFVMMPVLVALGVFAAVLPAQGSVAMVCASVVLFAVGCVVLIVTGRSSRRLDPTP